MARTTRLFLSFFLALIMVPAIVSCSSTKHVPDGKLLLDKTKIKQTYGIDIPYWEESLNECIKKLKD